MKILVCFSGGIDSNVVLRDLMAEHSCEVLLFDYKQPHAIELLYAVKTAEELGIPYTTIQLDKIQKTDSVVFAARNLVFAARGVEVAVTRGFDAVAFGCNKTDWTAFPDCRPVFWEPLRRAVKSAYGIELLTPLLYETKECIVGRAVHTYGLDLKTTWSCYQPVDGHPCGECAACICVRKAVGSITDVHD